MKKKEVAILINQALEHVLSATDFRLKSDKALLPGEKAFVRQIPGGRQMLFAAISDYWPDFVFSLCACIRLDAVENIFNQFSGVEPKFQSSTTTTITRLEYFTGGPAEYKVASPNDVAVAGDMLDPIIRNKILLFFEQLKDVESLDRAVNRQQPSIDITQNPSGAMHSLILANLAHNPDFDRLLAKHRGGEILAEMDHPLNRLVDYLKKCES
jgi:hypothetical protein